MVGLVFKVLRYVVVFAGGGVASVSDDALMQMAGLLVSVGSLAVSIVKDYREAQAKKATTADPETIGI